MDRRKSLKAIALGTLGAGIVLEACQPGAQDKAAGPAVAEAPAFTLDRMNEEKERDEALMKETFFTPHEMATITILADIIIPADDVSGSASEAEVPAFIEFIVKDMPQHQVPMRGGLRWVDLQCVKRYDKAFVDCTDVQRMELVDLIAWPAKAKPEMAQGVAFFSLMRNLTASGFYTSKMGVNDLGYAGNTPNQWKGVPEEVLAQYGLAYSEKENSECVKFD